MKPNKTGYYMTANKNIPLNDREPGEIADVAWAQLKPYREAAQTWPVYKHYEDNRHKNKCRVCSQNIYFDKDEDHNPYDYSDEEILALIVAHVRQCHSKIVTGEVPWPIETT